MYDALVYTGEDSWVNRVEGGRGKNRFVGRGGEEGEGEGLLGEEEERA